MTVYCSDKDMIEKIGHITLVEFTLGKYDRKVLDALDVVGIIQKEYPDADIECLGECDFVVEYKKPEKEGVCGKCGGTLVQRKDDHPDTVKERLKVYHEQTEPLKAYYEKQGTLSIVVGREDVADTSRLTLEALKA